MSRIIHGLGLTLLLLSLVLWLLVRRTPARPARVIALVLAASALFVPAPAGAQWKLLLEKDSAYQRIRVEDDGSVRSLYVDRTLQSAMTLGDPTQLRLAYYRYASLGLAFAADPRKLLVIGLGGGSMPKKYRAEFPSLVIDVAEIDPEVIEIARRYFFLREDGNLRVHATDGRRFLARTPERYDVIVLDAYHGQTIPFHLTTREFFRIAETKLTPTGALVVNVIGAVTGSPGRITRAIVKTVGSVYPQVYVFATGASSDPASLGTVQNVIVVATRAAGRIGIDEILKKAGALGRDLFPSPLTAIATAYQAASIATSDVPLLTDDFAPTDSLLVR